MAHSDHGHHDAHGHHGPRTMPTVLTAPEAVLVWQKRAMIVTAVFAVISVVFAFTAEGRQHLLRSYLMGVMTCFNFVGGALAFLLVQYLSGGKWGAILRRPLEAMTRTFGLVVVMMLPVMFRMKELYQWARWTDPQQTWQAYKAGLMTQEEMLMANSKHAMLNPISAIIQTVVVFAFMGLVISLANKWSLQRDADPSGGTSASYNKWRVRFENLAGPSTLIYVILMTDFVIVWVKSLDIEWSSSVYGAQFLVAQGYAVLALGILTLILLSKYEPIKTMFRTTEQHDLGKLAFAFTMLNIYLTFAEFLIIYSGNVPDEAEWYIHRIHGGWWVVLSLDVICHWVVPFCILLSRDFKRSRSKMIWLCAWMIGARFIDMFWLIEPNFKDAQGNLHLAANTGILSYVTMPIAVVACWMYFYLGQLAKRPLIAINDPDTEELLEPEHAH
ncbi:quinol:cytochrome c oxidoreductase quinone-binding subunit 2 [Bryocella elongata]|uniref:Quinol:cytochrome c oxidoreductase quinone-binding subunit 2 n=2 Tax=Bryocella elongata TaxID=863522 RepID=A0A1H5YHZ1_9BACT|nr:quinol:cytochrome c oxidoreductase quinone-binding subunit 2 [Bryocella elongata]